ncbi:MAG: ATP-binding protein [Planctomycetota bacterium]
MQYERWQRKNLKEALGTWRVVLLTGPRQCGKTTLSRQIASANVEYRTLDDLTTRQAAETDPLGFVTLSSKVKTLIIDEVQKAPELLTAVKQVVDQDNRPGQFLLTGSTKIQSLPTARESLAGRIGRVRLRPLTQGELRSRKPDFLDQAFKGEFPPSLHDCNRDLLIDYAFKGGFPEALRLAGNKVAAWHRHYIQSLVERDLVDIANLKKLDALYQLVDVMASWSSKYMDLSGIGNNLDLDRKTLQTYINALQAMFIVETVPAWTKTDYARVGKQKKSFMTDTGMMAAILAWSPKRLWLDPDRMGKIMETFAFQELSAHAESSRNPYRIYHFRDREKREIDFLIENQEKALLGIEIKSGATVRKDDAKHLVWFAENLAQGPFKGIILYAGESVLSFGKNIWAVPFSALWSR